MTELTKNIDLFTSVIGAICVVLSLVGIGVLLLKILGFV